MQAFELTDQMKSEGFSGGTVNVGGTAFNVGAALESGNGVIVTDDDSFANILRQYPGLKRMDTVPDGAKPVPSPLRNAPTAPAPGTPVAPVATAPPGESATEIMAEHQDDGPNVDPAVDPTAPSTTATKPPVAPGPSSGTKAS